jgi:hypothetical protein
MRPLLLLPFALACADPKDPADPGTDDTDAAADDTDAAADDTDAAADDTDVAADDTDFAPPPPWNSRVVGDWSTALNEGACGLTFDQGFVATAVEGTEDQFALRMNEAVGGISATFACVLSDAATYTCTFPPIQQGELESCMYQSTLSAIGGTVGEGVATISAYISQSAIGQYCPPIPPCEATASATANIGE